MPKATIRDINLDGKKVLVRVDYNVPLKDRKITDDTRIRETIPTINYLLGKKAKIILISHLGRPKGITPELRLDPLALRLSEILRKPVKKLDDCIGDEVEKYIENMRIEEIVLLENIRFYPQEEKNDLEFAKKLARLGEVYVNDAFGCAHRAHASTFGIANFLPAVAGFLMEKELKFLGMILENPARPFVTILGGAKVADKIKVIENLLKKVDALLIGGGMAYTFLNAEGFEIGKSLLDEKISLACEILKEVKQRNIKFKLPLDTVITEKLEEGYPSELVSIDRIPKNMIGADIGPKTIAEFSEILKTAQTIFWNGPLGVFEMPSFSKGTEEIAKIISTLSATTIVGGGDSVFSIKKLGLSDKFTHISTGGGASLEFLEGEKLPGVEVLKDLAEIRKI
ncbi:MAG: phosphoglycerate kinase [Armatimonadetes bacterium]|nr:phosphoglycerate kinase [Armatimonadota bacterium]